MSPAPPSGLSHGIEIEYKAFARRFFVNAPEAAALFLVATCSYGSTGFTIFFEQDSDQFKLMEQPPTGIVHFLQTFYAASWPTQGVSIESELPTYVTIVDAQGEHKVEVQRELAACPRKPQDVRSDAKNGYKMATGNSNGQRNSSVSA